VEEDGRWRRSRGVANNPKEGRRNLHDSRDDEDDDATSLERSETHFV
jgi:hypothetical protein